MGKFTDYFLKNYRCVVVENQSEYVDDKGNVVVTGNCICQLRNDINKNYSLKYNKIHTLNNICSWKHIVDRNGNVIKSTETNCPCMVKKQNYQPIKNHKYVMILIFVFCGILVIAGIFSLYI